MEDLDPALTAFWGAHPDGTLQHENAPYTPPNARPCTTSHTNHTSASEGALFVNGADMSTRLSRGEIQTPQHTFTNGKRTIVLYGVSHIAEQSFWVITRDRIQDLENAGYEVHYEMVKNDMDNPPMEGVLDYKALSGIFKLQSQKDGLIYGDTWKRTDITTSQLYAQSDMEKVRHLGVKMTEAMTAIKALDPAPTGFLRFLMKAVLTVSRFIKQGSLAGIPRSIIVDQRNGVALNAALRAKGNVVAIWGAEHLPGISAGLRAHGFRHVNTAWTTAIAARAAA